MNDPILQHLEQATKILVIQADNPDADSLGSALALEELLETQGKHVSMYCGVTIPTYLQYISGWDRVSSDIPPDFELSIVVDTSTNTLLEKLIHSSEFSLVKRRPCIVIDHHATVDNQIDFTELKIIDETKSSASEMVYDLAKSFGWPISAQAGNCIMAGVLGDTQGLTNELTTAQTYRMMSELTELGADRPALEEARREHSKMPREILAYKGQLLQRVEYTHDDKVAVLRIPNEEITAYSPLYNPPALVQYDMLQVVSTGLAIVFKTYDDGRITASIRANQGFPIAAQLAEKFHGGGHAYAAGFKITDGTPYETIKHTCLGYVTDLLEQQTVAN